MKRPTRTFPPSPGQMPSGVPKSLPDPSLAPEAFEELIKNRGLRWKHEEASPCPNIRDLEANVHNPNCKLCSNGMLFFGGREIHGVAQANKLERIYEINGTFDVGEMVVTFSAYADGPDGTPGVGAAVSLQHFDRLTCLDYTTKFQELVEHSSTGIDRLRYPAVTIDFLATKSKTYYINQHFIIDENGYIKWTSQDQPSYDQMIERGEIFTVSYTIQPSFLVVQVLHEIRATKAVNPLTGVKTAVRLPQQVLIRREYMFDTKSDTDGLDSQRSPRSGGTVNTPD